MFGEDISTGQLDNYAKIQEKKEKKFDKFIKN